MEIGACYVEAVDMAWYDTGDKKDGVEDTVHAWARDDHSEERGVSKCSIRITRGGILSMRPTLKWEDLGRLVGMKIEDGKGRRTEDVDKEDHESF